jgi:hypothetical protein
MAPRRGRLYVEEAATQVRRPYLFGDSFAPEVTEAERPLRDG